MIIGFSGKAQSGKDMLAQYLVENHGFHRLAFADALKQGCQKLFGWPHWDLTANQKATPDMWWSECLGREVSPRILLQEIGVMFREHFDKDFWAHVIAYQLERKYLGSNVVISDLRFPNECELIRRYHGKLVRVEREDSLDLDHVSETALDDFEEWDCILLNHRAKSDAFRACREMLRRFGLDDTRRV